MTTLYDYTGHEAGVILFSDGSTILWNWSAINGIPRELTPGSFIGFNDLHKNGELLPYVKVDVPEEVIKLMQNHERENGESVSAVEDFHAISIPDRDVIVVTSDLWN
jgi:hypothetical protein